MRRFELPAGLAPGEVSGFVELQLEELSPFPLDQLLHGRVVADGAVFVYAAYRRRFTAEELQAWEQLRFVLPEFAGLLRLTFAEPTVVLLRSPEAMTALRFEPGSSLPMAGVGRALPADAGEADVQRVREKLLSAVGGEGVRIRELRLSRLPEQRPQGLRFTYAAEDGGTPVDVTIPAADCWPMDIRDEAFVTRQRQQLRVDLLFWRVVLGAAAVIALLFVGEIFLLGARGYIGWVKSRVESRAELVAELEEKQSIANRVAEFDRSDMQPIDMILAVAAKKPASVVFTRAIISVGNRLEFSATTPNVSDVNAFEAAIKSMPEVESVAIANDLRTSAEGTTFSMTVAFKPGAFPAGTHAAALPRRDRAPAQSENGGRAS